jgi:hypothetical protein
VCAGGTAVLICVYVYAGVQHPVAAGSCCKSCVRQPLAAVAVASVAYCCAACTVHTTVYRREESLEESLEESVLVSGPAQSRARHHAICAAAGLWSDILYM